MAGVNKVILVGRLGKDPEVREISGGGQVVSFSIATSESWKDKQSGEKKEKTEWHNIVIWNESLGKIAEKYLKKGKMVYVEGQLQTRKWTKDGVDRYATEVVLQRFRGELVLLGDNDGGGGGRSGDGDPGPEDSDRRGGGRPSGGRSQSQGNQPLEEDIPF